MKINFSQLETHLTKQLTPLYLISGEEPLLKQEALNLIRKAAKKAAFNERICLSPTTGFDWETLYPQLHSNSLLAEKQLIELDLRQALPDKVGSNILQEYSQSLSSECLLLIQLNKLEDKIAKSAWFKALEKVGVLITIWPLAREQMPQWIMQRARRYKMNLGYEVVNLLAEFTEGNLAAAAQTIEKIYLYPEKQNITVDLLKTILADESHFNLFDYIEHLIAGDSKRTLAILENLRSEGIEPSIILWGITRELRLLTTLAKEKQRGMTLDSLFQKHRIFAKRQNNIRRFLNCHNEEYCLTLLNEAAKIDAAIKGANALNVWSSLEMFTLRFS